MKKTILVSAVVLVIIACFFSSSYSINAKKTVNLELVKEVENLPSTTIRLGYSKLNSAEKVVFWHRHFDRFIQSPNISPELKSHILKVKTFTTEELYNTLSNEQTQAKVKAFTKEWYFDPIEKGKFNKDQLLIIGTMFGMGKDNTNNLSSYIVGGANSPSQLITCVCYYSLSCPTGLQCFRTDFCSANGPFNCGISGTSRCNGQCK